ncbi:MAG: NADH-quinone oxidoreductase subunit C [Chloroflexi bacterium]|nr:NADH-quinone oxidoreductase subunit C [Chloroflexota bacterium]|tara:strand:- start:33563 stop:34006 length:444 start_codon:yes stop_codon:yes gene_type:complete
MTIIKNEDGVINRINSSCINSHSIGIGNDIYISPQSVNNVIKFLKEDVDLNLNYLTSITAVDYIEFIEIIYHLFSINKNHRIILKTKCYEIDNPVIPSISDLWKGAELQEREIWDLMGVEFSGHPNMKRVLLWEGFEGHPLRRNYTG